MRLRLHFIERVLPQPLQGTYVNVLGISGEIPVNLFKVLFLIAITLSCGSGCTTLQMMGSNSQLPTDNIQTPRASRMRNFGRLADKCKKHVLLQKSNGNQRSSNEATKAVGSGPEQASEIQRTQTQPQMRQSPVNKASAVQPRANSYKANSYKADAHKSRIAAKDAESKPARKSKVKVSVEGQQVSREVLARIKAQKAAMASKASAVAQSEAIAVGQATPPLPTSNRTAKFQSSTYNQPLKTSNLKITSQKSTAPNSIAPNSTAKSNLVASTSQAKEKAILVAASNTKKTHENKKR